MGGTEFMHNFFVAFVCFLHFGHIQEFSSVNSSRCVNNSKQSFKVVPFILVDVTESVWSKLLLLLLFEPDSFDVILDFFKLDSDFALNVLTCERIQVD